MMVDPDGELAWFVIPVIVGAVTGGINVATNWSAIQAAGGGWGSFGTAAASFGVGFAAGAGATLGAGAAAPALTAAMGTGAASGAALGAIGGGISGFTLGAGNTWMNGGGFYNGLGAGMAGAGIGALAGGITGGTFSGVKSLIQGKNFWTGLPKAGSGYNYSNYDLGVERPKLGTDFPKRELPRIDGPLNRVSPNPGGNPDIGNIRIDLEMGRAANMRISQADKSIFTVTREGIVLPKGAKIPAQFIENPYRSSSYGLIKNGKFIETLRIDPPTPAGMKGPNFSHFHLNGSGAHLTKNWPWW